MLLHEALYPSQSETIQTVEHFDGTDMGRIACRINTFKIYVLSFMIIFVRLFFWIRTTSGPAQMGKIQINMAKEKYWQNIIFWCNFFSKEDTLEEIYVSWESLQYSVKGLDKNVEMKVYILLTSLCSRCFTETTFVLD